MPKKEKDPQLHDFMFQLPEADFQALRSEGFGTRRPIADIVRGLIQNHLQKKDTVKK